MANESTASASKADTYFAVVNPAAGGGKSAKLYEAALRRLEDAGLSLEVRLTSKAGDATELAREGFAAGYRRFLAVGGDGTSFEVVNGLFPVPPEPPAVAEDHVTLGILPMGTGNSFLRDFGILDGEQAIDAIIRGNRYPCDVVSAQHDGGVVHSINIFSIGFTANVGALTNDRFKPFGAAGYVFAVVASVVGLKQPLFRIRLDNGEPDDRPCTFLSFSNSKFTGGAMKMAPHADVADGKVDVIRVGRMGRMDLLKAFPRIFKGTHLELDAVEEAQATRVDFDGLGEEDVMIDGEVLRLKLSSLEVLPGALQVLA